MLLLKSIFICSEYLIWQKSFMEEMSKECVLQNLNLGHWCQVLGLVLVLHLKSWIPGLDLDCQVLHLGSWILLIPGLGCRYHKVGHKLLLSTTGITKCDRKLRQIVRGVTKCDKQLSQYAARITYDHYCKAGTDDITKSINILNAINILKFERGSKFFCKMQNWYSWA